MYNVYLGSMCATAAVFVNLVRSLGIETRAGTTTLFVVLARQAS
jgi:hypothetical protein